jgi:uncharacterized protein (TIRG00374 family)
MPSDTDQAFAPVSASSFKPSRSQLSGLLVVLVLGGMVTLAATKMNLGAASTALTHASLFWVGLAAAAVAAAFLCRSESWFAAVRAALPHSGVQRSAVARSLMIGNATSAVTPARVGEAARTWLLSRRIGGGQCATVLGTVVAQTLLNGIVLALLALFVLTSSTTGFDPETIAAAVIVPLLMFAALWAGGRLLISTFSGEAGADAGFGRRVGCWISRQVSGTGRGLAMFHQARTALHAGGCQLAAWVLQGFAGFSILMALHLHPSVTTAAAILLAINISAVVPVTPANVGLFQAACIAVLTPLGVSGGHALAYGLLLQAVEIGVALAIGIPAILREGLTLRELGEGMGRRGVLVAVVGS